MTLETIKYPLLALLLTATFTMLTGCNVPKVRVPREPQLVCEKDGIRVYVVEGAYRGQPVYFTNTGAISVH